MIKAGEKTFFLIDRDGLETPFSVTELQSELIYCFLSSGLRDNSCFAEDIALAIEYSLSEDESFQGRISTDELALLVIETLESGGFSEVAECFRRRNSREVEVLFSTGEESLRHVAFRHGLVAKSKDADKVINLCSSAFKAMGVEQSPLGLIIELMRFYQHHSVDTETEKTKNRESGKGDYLLNAEEVVSVLPDDIRKLLNQKIIKIRNISVYHPSIRLFIDFTALAVSLQLKPVLTEMLFLPYASELAQQIDTLVSIMQDIYRERGGIKEIPVYLAVNNMNKFMEKYFAADPDAAKDLASSLANSVVADMVNPVYKVRF